jgi:hypothetical protein
MPPALRRSMGHLPDGFLSYFTRRFPRLFLHVYEVVARDGFVKSETSFRVSWNTLETRAAMIRSDQAGNTERCQLLSFHHQEYFARPEED